MGWRETGAEGSAAPAPAQVHRIDGPLPADVAESVLALAQAVEAQDGVAALSEQSLLELRRPVRETRHLLRRDEATDALAGYAQLDVAGASAELAVHPRHRRRGHGRALLDALRAGGGPAVWAHGDLPAAQALAASAGMERARTLLQMAVDLPASGVPADRDPAAHGLPGARTFRPGDAEAWVALNARAFAGHPEQGRLTLEDLRARQDEDWFDPGVLWLVPADVAAPPEAATPHAVVAESAAIGTDSATARPFAAYLWLKILPGEDCGEIYALGVDPAFQGRGLGGRLTSLALAELAARGRGRASLYVEGDNVAALRTYERRGFERVAVDVRYR